MSAAAVATEEEEDGESFTWVIIEELIKVTG